MTPLLSPRPGSGHGLRLPLYRALLGLGLAVGAGCTPPAGNTAVGEVGPRGDSRTITETDLSTATQLNLYDYVAAERPRWLRSSGSMSRNAFPVIVFVEDTRLGGPQTLKTLTTGTVRMLRYYEASAAQQKFAGRDIGPVIQVIMK